MAVRPPSYAFGHSEAETRRLRQQANLFDPTTRHFLQTAGITTGLKVLEVGSGAGDVALLVADLVGPRGTVVGVELDCGILQTARERVHAARLGNVSFVAGDVAQVPLAGNFDAAVGRCVLVHNRDPAAILHAVARCVRPGGIVAFEEPGHTAFRPTAIPPSALMEQVWDWMLAAYCYAGIGMGLLLREVFRDAGLPEPAMHLHAAAGGGPEWAGYAYIASHLRVVLPLILRAGVATAEEVGVDTFAERLRAEVTGQGGVMTTWSFVTAWCRKD